VTVLLYQTALSGWREPWADARRAVTAAARAPRSRTLRAERSHRCRPPHRAPAARPWLVVLVSAGAATGAGAVPPSAGGGSEPQAQPSAPPASTPADSGAFMDLSAAWRAVRQDREHAPESPSSIKPLRSHDANPHLQCGCSRSGDGPGSVRRGATPTGHCHSPSSSRNRCRGIRAASPAGRESEILRRFVLPVE
jgi:hypothetical protein